MLNLEFSKPLIERAGFGDATAGRDDEAYLVIVQRFHIFGKRKCTDPVAFVDLTRILGQSNRRLVCLLLFTVAAYVVIFCGLRLITRDDRFGFSNAFGVVGILGKCSRRNEARCIGDEGDNELSKLISHGTDLHKTAFI